MRPGWLSSFFRAIITGALVGQIIISGRPAARAEVLTTSAETPQTTVKLKAPRAADSPLVWDKPVSIKPKTKPHRERRRPRPKLERVPLLTLEWKVLKRAAEGSQEETNPATLFHTGDRLRIAVKTNQDGYLYIIHHSEAQDGAILFPDSRINSGQNFVKKNQEILLPLNCLPEYTDERGNCWWQMTPPAGREVFSVIFSRDMITSLPNEAAQAGGVVKLQVINDLKKTSGQVLARTSRPNLSSQQGGGAGRYVTWVTNKNVRDNEELIETIVLTHGE